jgi:hypothetical protein
VHVAGENLCNVGERVGSAQRMGVEGWSRVPWGAVIVALLVAMLIVQLGVETAVFSSGSMLEAKVGKDVSCVVDTQAPPPTARCLELPKYLPRMPDPWPDGRPLLSVMMGVSGTDAGKGLEDEFRRLVKSLLLTASCPFRMVVVADDVMAEAVARVRSELCLDVNAGAGVGQVEIVTQRLTSEMIEKEWRAKDVVVRHHAGPFTQAKYSLETLFPHERAVLSVDTDTIFLDDVCRLWREASFDLAANPEAIVSAAITDLENPTSFLNAGISFMRLDRMRAVGWSSTVLDETKRTPHCLSYDRVEKVYFGDKGDQNFLICAVKNHPQWLVPMRLRWNLTRCKFFEEERPLSSGENLRHGLGVLHFNCAAKPNYFRGELNRLDCLSLNQLQEHRFKGL